MSDTTELATTNHAGDGAPTAIREGFSSKEIALMKRTICKGATDEELSMFIQQCKRTGLDPFTGQIHAVKRWDKSEDRKVLSVQVGIDGFRLIADRTGKWRGVKGPYWCGPDGQWRDVWLADEHPAAAKVGVLRSDFSEVRWGIARWSDYVATKKNNEPTYMWRKMGAHMLAKCAESLALRMAFPNDLSGLYTTDEMEQAGGEVQTVDAETIEAADVDPETGEIQEEPRHRQGPEVPPQPPPEEPKEEPEPTPIDDRSAQNLAIHARESLGLEDEDRYNLASYIFGREISSFMDLSVDEGAKLRELVTILADLIEDEAPWESKSHSRAFVRHIIEEELPLRTEEERQAALDSYAAAAGPEE